MLAKERREVWPDQPQISTDRIEIVDECHTMVCKSKNHQRSKNKLDQKLKDELLSLWCPCLGMSTPLWYEIGPDLSTCRWLRISHVIRYQANSVHDQDSPKQGISMETDSPHRDRKGFVKKSHIVRYCLIEKNSHGNKSHRAEIVEHLRAIKNENSTTDKLH